MVRAGPSPLGDTPGAVVGRAEPPPSALLSEGTSGCPRGPRIGLQGRRRASPGKRAVGTATAQLQLVLSDPVACNGCKLEADTSSLLTTRLGGRGSQSVLLYPKDTPAHGEVGRPQPSLRARSHTSARATAQAHAAGFPPTRESSWAQGVPCRSGPTRGCNAPAQSSRHATVTMVTTVFFFPPVPVQFSALISGSAAGLRASKPPARTFLES